MNWGWYLAQLLARTVEVLPWLLAGLGGLAIVSFSPLGRGLLRYLRTREDETALNEQLLQELEELRKVLGDVVERLDFTERQMAQKLLGPLRPPALPEATPLPRPGQAITPH
jgi:hypothetical protein